MARPKLELDEVLVADLARAQLTDKEIAQICKCSVDTLTRRFADSLKEWKLEGVGSVRRKLFTTALGESKGSTTAMIFFLKNYGGMADVRREEPPPIGRGELPSHFKPATADASKPN